MPPTPDMIPIWREDDTVMLVDQRLLPGAWVELRIRTVKEMAEAIQTLAIRGAPAIGIAGAYGVWLAAQETERRGLFGTALAEAIDAEARLLMATRPTAINLRWAIERMARADQASPALMAEADAIAAEDLAMCKAIGAYGASLIAQGEGILTHCNAGGLATGGYGTALGVIRAAHAQGKRIHVYVDETRPVGQGARLTTYELKEAGIPFTLISDVAAASLMAAGRIQRIVTGADRIASNGDAANKIGTYALAVLAQYHGIPFHIAAPSSTIDVTVASGAEIPIEERAGDEVTAPYRADEFFRGIGIFNPAFDVVPHALIASIITEKGVVAGPYEGRLV